jgi:hypothetical protein
MAKQMAFAPMEGKALSALIGSIGKAAESLNGKVQQAAVQCVAHAFLHGDVRPATQLFEAMTKGMRRQSIVSWFEINGPFAFDTKKNAFGLHLKEEWVQRINAEYKEHAVFEDKLVAHCTKLLSVSWLEAKAEKIESEVDVLESIEKLLASISKKVATAQKDGATKPVKHDKLRDYLADAVLKYKADMEATVIEDDVELGQLKAA